MDRIAFFELSGQDLHRQRVLKLALDGAFQRSRPKIGVIAGLCQVFACPLGDFQSVALIRQQSGNPPQLDGDDARQVLLA